MTKQRLKDKIIENKNIVLIITGIIGLILINIYLLIPKTPRDIAINGIVKYYSSNFYDCGLTGSEINVTSLIKDSSFFISKCSSVSNATYTFVYNPCKCEDVSCMPEYVPSVIFTDNIKLLAIFSFPHAGFILDSSNNSTEMLYCLERSN